MTSLPGPNQTRTTDRRARLLPSEVLFRQRPAPARSMAQAIAAGLQIDPASRDAGYADGSAGNTWDPRDFDMLSYAAGFVAGTRYGRTKGG